MAKSKNRTSPVADQVIPPDPDEEATPEEEKETPVETATPEVSTPLTEPSAPPETTEPEPPAPPVVEPEAEQPKRKFEMASIGDLDRTKLFKYFYAMVFSQTHGRTGEPAVREIGKIFGAETYEEELAVWAVIKNEVLAGQRS